jgi:hypothetical protein
MRRLIFLLMFVFAVYGQAFAYTPISDEPSTSGCPNDPTQCSGYKVRADINQRFGGQSPISPVIQGLSYNPVVLTFASQRNYQAGDTYIDFDATSGNITYTLPAWTSSGIQLAFKRVDSTSHTVTILPNGTNKIDGLTSVSLLAKQPITLGEGVGVTGNWDVLHAQSGLPIAIAPTDFTPVDPGRAYSSEWKAISMDQSTIWTAANGLQIAISPSGTPAPTIDMVAWDSDNTGSNIHSCGGSTAGSLTLCGINAVVGEGLYAWLCATNGALSLTWALPSGWSWVGQTTNGTTVNMCGWAYKTAVSADTSAPTYLFQESPNGTITGQMIEVAGGNVPGSQPAGSVVSGNPSAASITTGSVNNLILAGYGAESNRSGFIVPAGFNLIVDPNAPVQVATNHQGGTNSKYMATNGRTSGANPILGAFKVQASAGATGAAASSSGQILLAYANGPGEIDQLNIIRLGTGGSPSIVKNALSVWRDGESTPSINGVQLQDLASRRGITTSARLHTRYIGFGAAVFGGGGESESLYLTMPFTQSVVMQLSNPDTSNQASLWSNVGFHSNSLAAAAWNGFAHFEAISNASYPSADSVTAYTEDTLCNIAGAGHLWDVVMQVTGGDINSQAFEEGRLRIYINGETTASWDTSGTEDAFQSSFNWNTETFPFGTDFYGATYYVAPTGSVAGAFGAYRIFGDKDPISFSNGIKVTWTSGNSTQGGVTNPVSLFSAVGIYFSQ